MNMHDYFENTSGRGVLATASKDGKVDAAIYSAPHVQQDGSIALIMRERLSHMNISENPHANFLFMEDRPGFQGVRLFLKKIKESTDADLIKSMKRRHLSPEEDKAHGPCFLVHFTVVKVLPLIGADPSHIPFEGMTE